MVHINLFEIINDLRKKIILKNGLEVAFYQYSKKEKITQETKDFYACAEDTVAFYGYSNLNVENSTIQSLIEEKQAKKIGYDSNIYTFLGVHIAAKKEFTDVVKKKFERSDLKTRYIIAKLLFSNYSEVLNSLALDIHKDDAYKPIISYLINDVKSVTATELSSHLLKLLESQTVLDTIDLIILEDVQKKAFEIKYIDFSAIETIEKILNEFPNAIKKITNNRYDDRSGLNINDEYDVQDILFSMLKGFFNDLDREDVLQKLAGASSRVDLIIKSYGIIIEIKMIKDTDSDHKKVIKELKQDIVNYSAWKDLKYLIMFTYDPYNKTSDDMNFKELEKNNIILYGGTFSVRTILVH